MECIFMNNKMPLEIERKYLIKMPSVALLEQQPLYMKIDMVQVYLNNQGATSKIARFLNLRF